MKIRFKGVDMEVKTLTFWAEVEWKDLPGLPPDSIYMSSMGKPEPKANVLVTVKAERFKDLELNVWQDDTCPLCGHDV